MSIDGNLKSKEMLTGKISGAKMIYIDAYNIAVQNGFLGSVDEWLKSLKGEDGITPHIGANGNWFIGETDTGVKAGGSGSGSGGGGGVASPSEWEAEITGYERTDLTPITSSGSWRVIDHEQVETFYPMEIGDTVYITVNGTEYERKLLRRDLFGRELYLYAGNPALDSAYTGEGTAEPFLFYISPEMGFYGIFVKATSMVKIEWNRPIVERTLPVRYLPYAYASRDKVNGIEETVNEHQTAIEDISSELSTYAQSVPEHKGAIAKLNKDVLNLNTKSENHGAQITQLADLISDLETAHEEIREQIENFEPSSGSGLPEVTAEDNGKIPMVVDGAVELVDFPAGTQYDMQTITIYANEWMDNGSLIHYIWYNNNDGATEPTSLEGCDIDVSLLASSTPEQFEAAAESGVYCAGSTGAELEFRCLYSVPIVDLSFSVRITTPRTLSYAVSDDGSSIIIAEGNNYEEI